MKPGAVLVDIAIDQGGCFEDSRPTTHDEPDLQGAQLGVLLRGQHARRGAADVDLRAHQRDHALCAQAGRQGLEGACSADAALAKGLSTHEGKLLNAQVGEALNLPDTDPASLLAG